MDILKKCYDDTRADAVRSAGLYPYFHVLESMQGPEVVMEGRRRIMLGSNNYLGLTCCPEVMEAGRKAIEKYGTGCSGSRFLNGTLDLHLELEHELAAFLGQEDALTFGTGFQTNLSIISCIVGRHDTVICDIEDHASIYCACQMSYGKMLRFRHNDMESLKNCLERVPQESGALIVVDGLFSIGGDLANLPEIVRLARQYGARIMVDDAHGLGTIGVGGRGTAFHFGLEKDIDLFMGTFSKSLASLGGFVAGKRKVIDYMRHNSRPFIFSASLPPANAAVALAALRHLEAHPELPLQLQELGQYARKALQDKNIPIKESALKYPTPVIPFYTYTLEATLRAAKDLYDAGVYVNPFVPPGTPEGQALLRTSYMVTHTTSLIDEAVEIFDRVLKTQKENA